MNKIFYIFLLSFYCCNTICSQTNYLVKESGTATANSISFTEKYTFTKSAGDWKGMVLNDFRIVKAIGDVIKNNTLSLYSCSGIAADNGVILNETNSLDQWGNSTSKLKITIPTTMNSNSFTMTIAYSLGTKADISTIFNPVITFPIAYSSIPSYIIGNYYLEPGTDIESNNVVIENKALEITSGATDLKSVIELLASWISTNITYALNTTPAYQVLMSRIGNCEGQSKLMIAFCRSLGIPARLTTGGYFPYEMRLPLAQTGSAKILDQYKTGTLTNEQVGHAVYEVYYPGIGWVRGDPAMNTVNFGWPTLLRKCSGPDANVGIWGGYSGTIPQGQTPPTFKYAKTFSTAVTGFSTAFVHSKTKLISGTKSGMYLYGAYDQAKPTGFYDEVKIENPVTGTTCWGLPVLNNTSVITPCTESSFYAKFITDNNPTTYANTFDWAIVLYHSDGEYTYAEQNGIMPNANTPNFWGESCVWKPITGILPVYDWALNQDGSIYGIVKVTAHVNDGTTQYYETTIGVSPQNNIHDVIYSTDTTVDASCIGLNLTNVTISGTPTVTFNTNGLGITINGTFDAPLGSKLIINK